MKYKFGDWVMTPKGVGIVIQVYKANSFDGMGDENEYFVRFEKSGQIFRESELIEWTGAW